MEKSKVYILIDDDGRIIKCDGGYSIKNIDNISDWIFIDEGFGDKYNLCQNNYFQDGLYTDDGICQYKYVGGKVKKRTSSEIQADIDKIPEPEKSITIDELNEAITDIQLAMADTYESDDNQLTDLQMAVAELYEIIIGGGLDG